MSFKEKTQVGKNFNISLTNNNNNNITFRYRYSDSELNSIGVSQFLIRKQPDRRSETLRNKKAG